MVQLWTGSTLEKPVNTIGVRLLSEFPDAWSAIQWACRLGGPGIYALAGQDGPREPYAFRVIDKERFDVAECDFNTMELASLVAAN